MKTKYNPAFTLVEMLVAVGMAVALIAAVAAVFSLATTSVGISQANTEIHNQLRVAFSWLDRDFRRIRLDGPLVLSSQAVPYISASQPGSALYDYEDSEGNIQQARADRLFFLISGAIPSLLVSKRERIPDDEETTYYASLATISYGQDISVYGRGGLPKEFSTSLTRYSTLMVGKLPTEPEYDLSRLANDPGHIQRGSFAGILAVWYNNPWPWTSNWGRPNISNGQMLHTRMLDHILSIRIVRYRKPDKPKKYWLPGDEKPNARVFDMPPGEDKIIGPRYTKPLWIDIEITVRDAAGHLDEGYSSIYRMNLPITSRQMADWEAIEENAGGGW